MKTRLIYPYILGVNYTGVCPICQTLVIFCNIKGDRSRLLGNTLKHRAIAQRKAQVNPVSLQAFQLRYSLNTEWIMNQPANLSLEQQFSIRSFESQVNQMSREQAQDFLIKLYEQMIVRENMYKHFLRHQWGLEPGAQMP